MYVIYLGQANAGPSHADLAYVGSTKSRTPVDNVIATQDYLSIRGYLAQAQISLIVPVSDLALGKSSATPEVL